MRRILLFAVLLLLAVLKAAAQSTAPDVGDGQAVPLVLPGEHNKTNLLTARMTLTNFYDSNIGSTATNQVGNFSWFIQPQLAVMVSRPHVDCSFNYSPALTIDQRFRDNDLFAHNLGLDLKYRPTRRMTLRVRESLRVETHLLDRLTQRPSNPEFSVLDQPNDLVLTPPARRIYEEAGVDVGYLVDPYTIIGISGNFAQSRFRNLPDQAPVAGSLIDSQFGGGRAFFSHRLSRRHSVGAMYQLQSYLFQGGQARAITHSILYTHSIALTPSMLLSFFAGPEFSRLHNQLLVNIDLGALIGQFSINTFTKPTSFSGGATYQWTGKRTVFLGTLVDRVSDGGGLFGVSRFKAVTGDVRRRLGPRLTAGLGLSYGTTSALGLSSSFSSSTTLSATSSLSWSVSQHVGLELRYARQRQGGYSSSILLPPGDHNLFYVSLTYQFTRPLGR